MSVYKSSYSSVTSELSELSDVYDCIQADINNLCLSNTHSCGSFYAHTVYRINIENAIKSLCAGKIHGIDGICSDNLKRATDSFNLSSSIILLYIVITITNTVV